MIPPVGGLNPISQKEEIKYQQQQYLARHGPGHRAFTRTQSISHTPFAGARLTAVGSIAFQIKYYRRGQNMGNKSNTPEPKRQPHHPHHQSTTLESVHQAEILEQQKMKRVYSVIIEHSDYSDKSYPSVAPQEDQPTLQQARTYTCVDPLKITCEPHSLIGFIVYQDDNAESNYATGFLIANSLVLTAANPMYKRNPLNGELTKLKPASFFTGCGDNRKKFAVINYKLCEEYRTTCQGMHAQDYEHASLNKRLEHNQYLQNYDYMLLQLGESIIIASLMEIVSDFDAQERQVRIIGYGCDQQYSNLTHQDRQMKFLQEQYCDPAQVTGHKIDLHFKASKLLIGSPILIQHQRNYSVIGINLRQHKKKKLSTGLLITKDMLCRLQKWMTELSFIPKIRSFHDSPSSLVNLSLSDERSRKSSHQIQSEIGVLNREIGETHQNIQLYWSLKTQYARYFRVVDKTVVKKKEEEGEYHQIIVEQPILNNTCRNTKIKIIKFGGQYPIAIGLITRQRFTAKYSGDKDHQQSIGFWTVKSSGVGQGKLYKNGIKIQQWSQQLFLDEDDILTIVTDLRQNTVRFNINDKQKKQIALPESMRDQEIFVFAAMKKKNDSLQIIL